MDNLSNIFMDAFASLFAIVNPVGMSPVFMAMTKNYSKVKQRHIAYLVAVYGAVLLIVTFFTGPYILKFFGISLPNIQVAGGALVFYTAWKMLNTGPSSVSPDQVQDVKEKVPDITFFPLTMPITAGPGSIAVTLALRIRNINNFTMHEVIGFLLAVIVVFCLVAFCYRFAEPIFKKLGHTGVNIATILSAFILLAISVGIIDNGLIGMWGVHSSLP